MQIRPRSLAGTVSRQAFKDAEPDEATLGAATKHLGRPGAHEDLRQRTRHLEEGNVTKRQQDSMQSSLEPNV